jgi:hypothetical protein
MGVSVGPGSVIGQGSQGYHWSFSATVNGQAGVFTFWYPNDNYSEAAEYTQVYLEMDPSALEGIAFNDDTSEDGRDDDGRDDDGRGDDGDDDGMLAGNDEGDGIGDSV